MFLLSLCLCKQRRSTSVSFYGCDPTEMNLIPHLVSKVRKVYWQNGGQGPITLGVIFLDMFSNFAILENFPEEL